VVEFLLDGVDGFLRRRDRSVPSSRGWFAGVDLTGDLLADRAADAAQHVADLM
jgi:hypothetical protein